MIYGTPFSIIETKEPEGYKYEIKSEPCRCPVCYGKGIVDAGFYLSPGQTWTTNLATPETCRSCNGKGIVWKDES